jgi:hypothetical protein
MKSLSPKHAALLIAVGAPKHMAQGGKVHHGAHGGYADGGEVSDPHEEALHTAAQDLIDSVHSKDVSGVVDAFRAAFMALEALPHVEAGEQE